MKNKLSLSYLLFVFLFTVTGSVAMENNPAVNFLRTYREIKAWNRKRAGTSTPQALKAHLFQSHVGEKPDKAHDRIISFSEGQQQTTINNTDSAVSFMAKICEKTYTAAERNSTIIKSKSEKNGLVRYEMPLPPTITVQIQKRETGENVTATHIVALLKGSQPATVYVTATPECQ